MSSTQVPSGIFRGYDIRGIADTELTDENVSAIVSGYATYLLSRRIYDCVVGYDNRLSSPRLKEIAIKTLMERGVTVYDIGLCLSQIVYFAGYYFRTQGAMMITASHNPKEYNGFKFATGFSATMESDELIMLRNLVQAGEFSTRSPKGKYIKSDITEAYFEDLLKRIDNVRQFKVVVDSCNGSTGPFLPALLRRVGCTVIEQNTTPDGNFPLGVADPTERAVQERLAKRVVQEKADLGFSFDTDGDRIGIVDGEGNLIWNDTLVSLFVKDVLEHMPGAPIVFNALCSKQTSETIETLGGKPVMWKTGHSFIKAKVKETHAPFGGELSGHFFFMDNFYGHDDGAIAALRLLAYLTKKNQTLGEAVAELPQYISSPEIKLGLADAVKFQLIDNEITKEIKQLLPDAVITSIDGVRADTKETMVIIRASQNGPYITVKFEGKTQEQYDELKTAIHEILSKYEQIKFDEGVNTDAFEK